MVSIKNEISEVVLFLSSHKHITLTRMAYLNACDMQGGDANGVYFKPPSANSTRRRSRRILFQLLGHCRKDETRPKLRRRNILFQPTQKPVPVYKTSAPKYSRLVLFHCGGFKTCWHRLMLKAPIYVVIFAPYNTSFVSIGRSSMIIDVVIKVLLPPISY